MPELPPLDYEELFAQEHADQYLGCAECKKSHHVSAFCPKCKRCYFKALRYEQDEMVGTIVTCRCGHVDLWD